MQKDFPFREALLNLAKVRENLAEEREMTNLLGSEKTFATQTRAGPLYPHEYRHMKSFQINKKLQSCTIKRAK